MQQNAEHLCEAARQALESKKPDQALKHCEALREEYPDLVETWLISGQISSFTGNLQSAEDYFERALALEPDNTDILYSYSYCKFMLGENESCLSLLSRIKNPESSSVAINMRIANLYKMLGEHDSALVIFKEVSIRNPDNASSKFEAGELLKFKGKFDEAEQCYKQAIAADDHCYEAYLERSKIKKQTPSSNHTQPIEKFLETGVRSNQGAAKLFYALAKEYEDMDEYKRTFINIKRGADIQSQLTKYDVRNDIKIVETIKSVYSEVTATSQTGHCQSNEPIFIVGMPRSGTTLVERMLGSHSEIFPAGELLSLPLQLAKLSSPGLVSRETFPLISKTMVEESIKVDGKNLGLAYLESTRPRTGHSPHFTDKLPLNYYYCGLINRILPEAKIIHVHRNPMDTCFSNFKQLYTTGVYAFSYNLNALADYYLSYAALMDHWHKLLPGKILDIRYEDLIANPKATIEPALDFCGLEWEDSCLDFFRNPTPTSTASVRQVREPIFKTSIMAWKNYESWLEPMAEYFRANGLPVN